MADLKSLDVAGKPVLVRVDFNVLLDKDFRVTDDTRLRGAVPTIQMLADKGAKIILLSHFDRPLKKLLADGNIDRQKFTLKHLVEPSSKLLNKDVRFSEHTIGDEVKQLSSEMQNGEILLLENTRFSPGEEKGDKEFAS